MFVLRAFSQMYILNEDFNGASGTTPPNGWVNLVVQGGANDKWHFDNPGHRILNYPITDPFAIFDSDSISADGLAEVVALETPVVDASISNYILLYFVQVFDPGTGGSATIEAFDGDSWQEVTTYSSATSNPSAEIVDLSPFIGGITNARIRFKWSGNGSGFWAIDNIRIYASLPVDGGVVSIDSPNSPVVPGLQNVVITLGNFGYNTLTSTKIDWTANGVPQPQYGWNGSIGFGQTAGNIIIGAYNFQDPVMITVWQSYPNGLADLNPYNDTVSKYLVAALCGTYTIGGNNPDFVSISQVAEILNIAGVCGSVTFLVRDSTYYEQFELGDISGASEENTITFKSENGDSTKAIIRIIPGALKYEPMIYLNKSRHIYFQELELATGSSANSANIAVLLNGAKDIHLINCFFEVRNQSDFGIKIHGGSQNIEIKQNRFESISALAGAITISDEQTREIEILGNYIKGSTDRAYPTIKIDSSSRQINLTQNIMERCATSIYLRKVDSIRIQGNMINNSNDGVYLYESCSYVEISNNRLTNIKSLQSAPEGTSGITIRNSSFTDIFNNFIHTKGDGPVMGISLNNATSCRVCFNSINITNNDMKGGSNGILLTANNEVFARNNIFRIRYVGTPVYIDVNSPQLDFDKNDYYSQDKTIGYYNGHPYYDLTTWQAALGMDMNSLSVIPFFSSDTILSINQALLNNTGVPVAGINNDIDGTPRDPINPDIGAKEYNPCSTDAGINSVISPENPLNGGVEAVTVLLQNQGTEALTQVEINWSVNGQVQPSHSWTGNLAGSANSPVTIGNYNFQDGILYTLKAWTLLPNGINDCDHINDTISSQELAVPLCQNYYIGGTNPDFATIKEAITLLNLAGITCPVTLWIRDGTYREELLIKDIPGTSDTNTVTFRSQSGDSTRAIIQIMPGAIKYETMIYLEGSKNIIFQDLGLFTSNNTDLSYFNNAILMSKTENIRFEGCNFEVRKQSDLGIGIQSGCHGITIRQNRFVSLNALAFAINITGAQTRDIDIQGNNIKGPTEWLSSTISIRNDVHMINLTGNLIENCFRAIYLENSDSAHITGNVIKNTNNGIYIDNGCTNIEISDNRLSDIKSHESANEGTSGILVSNVTRSNIFNNFVHTSGDGPVMGINVQNSSLCKISFNSVNITNKDLKGKSKGFNLMTSTTNTGISAMNNICNVMNSGTPVYISANPVQIDFDHNDYFSNNHTLGYFNGIFYSDLTAWKESTNMDENSLSVTPFYSSETDLSINQVLLNNSGIPITGVTEDIDSILRDPLQPDIGAKEYSPCSNDAGINAVVSPESPLSGGTEEIRVILQNQGTSMLSSVKINFSVNAVLQTQLDWSGNLASGANTEVSLGDYNFQAGRSYIIKAWTSGPNNLQDCNNKNDTVSSGELAGPLCGIYTIGGNNPDFVSLSQAVEVLNSAGITCAVTFLVRDGIYHEKFMLMEIAGTSPGTTITFRSESGDNTKAVIMIDPTAVNYEPMILMDKSQYINFQELGLFTGSSSGVANSAVELNGAKNISIENCNIEAQNASDFGIVIQGGSQAVKVLNSRFECNNPSAAAVNITGDPNRDIEISENRINGSQNGTSTMIKVGNSTNGIILIGNHIEQSYMSVSAVGSDSIQIKDNLIKSTNWGLSITNGCSYAEISGNRLIDVKGTSGILVQNSTEIDLVNNYIQTSGEGQTLGINLQNITSCRTYYNSVNITNTEATSKGIYMNTCNGITARNNIFNIKSSAGLPIHIDLNVTNLNLDYNNYYNPEGIVGKVNNQIYSNLFDWGQTVNGDANSKVVNPYFKADTIPLPFQRILNGAGVPISGILYDIDGKIRNPQAPDIGCIEFFVDYGILELLSPTLNCFQPDVDSVIVYIRQYGDVPFENLKVAYQLDNGPVHIDTIPGPLIFDIIHTFSTTETISAPGEYLFKVWLINTLDDNINNDTLKTKRYSKPPPDVSVSYENQCTGWEVFFTGQATIADPYYIDKYEWFFGDGDSSHIQNPIHNYLAPGIYDVIFRAYSDAGCYSEAMTSVNIDPDFQGLGLAYNLENETCAGDGSGSLEFLVTGGNPPYTYYINGEQTSSSLISGFPPGKYEIRVVDSQNCSRTDSIESQTLVKMNPQIHADPLSGYIPLTVDFDFTANGAVSWTWLFPGEMSDTTKTPSFTFPEYGTYLVTLEVNSGPPYFCTETATVEIFVDIVVIIDANSVFTPNGDGYNDFFEIKSVGITEMNVNIFNQWGNKVYEIDDVDGEWDGNTKGGAKAPDGTYFYVINAKGINNLMYDRQGSVLLLRHGSAAFPNPVTDFVRIKPFDKLLSPVTVEVYSVFGQLAYSVSVEDPDNIIVDLSHLSSGIYILKATDGNQNCYARIIKN
jgi:gliding motility-associated-like protein